MLSIRQEVNNEILRYMESDGYHLAPGSKTPHTLDSWVFHYTNAAGNNDGIKIEINYSDRCHILPAIETHVSIPFLSDVKVRSLSPVELFATKINALIGRSAARDIYDVYNMVKHQLFVSDEEKSLLRKATVFYLTVGSSRKDNATPTEYTDFPQIDKIRFRRFVRNSCLCLGAVSILTLKSQDRSERLSLKAIGSDRIRERIRAGIQ